MTCQCGSNENFAACCEPLLAGEPAPSPERLMRSRYVAYCTGNVDYILNTTDPQRRLEVDAAAVEMWMTESKFTKLTVLSATDEGNKGTVEFIANYKTGDTPEQSHHELSKFRKQANRWYFRTGKVIPPSAPSDQSN